MHVPLNLKSLTFFIEPVHRLNVLHLMNTNRLHNDSPYLLHTRQAAVLGRHGNSGGGGGQNLWRPERPSQHQNKRQSPHAWGAPSAPHSVTHTHPEAFCIAGTRSKRKQTKQSATLLLAIRLGTAVHLTLRGATSRERERSDGSGRSSSRNSSASEVCVRARETDWRRRRHRGTRGVVTLGYREAGILASLLCVFKHSEHRSGSPSRPLQEKVKPQAEPGIQGTWWKGLFYS